MSVRVNSYQDLNPLLLHWSLIISGIAHSHQCVHVTRFQVLGDKKESLRHRICSQSHTDTNTVRRGHTSVNLVRVALVGLWVMRNLMDS